MGSLFIISAPSGAGKTSLVKALVELFPKVRISISHTTRVPRPGEKKGIDYHFTDHIEFEKMLKEEAFLEHAEVFGNHYGTSRSWVEETRKGDEDVILEIDWQGARQVRIQFPEVISIFVLPPSRQVLAERLVKRYPNDASIEARMAKSTEEMSHWAEYDYIICNDDFENALEDIKVVVQSNRLSYNSQKVKLSGLIHRLLD